MLVRELSNVQGERQPQIYGDDSRDPSESCVPESSCGRGVPSTTVSDRSRVGARFPGDSVRNAEQASAGGGPINPGGCVELHIRVTSEVGPTEVSGEFEECSTGVFSGTRRMHLRTPQASVGRYCHHRGLMHARVWRKQRCRARSQQH